MKRTIALSSSCAILLSPAFSLTAQSVVQPAIPTSHSATASSVTASPAPQTAPTGPAPVLSTLPSSEPLPSTLQTADPAIQKAGPVAPDSTSTPSANPPVQPMIPAASSAAPSASSPATASPAVQGSSTSASSAGQSGEIVSALPASIQKDLQEQLEPSSTISSHGEQPLSTGPEECKTPPQCGSRQALGFTMLAWGAALAGLIGLIVWIGKPGTNPCCDSTSDCCP